jgi:hypothetical protein
MAYVSIGEIVITAAAFTSTLSAGKFTPVKTQPSEMPIAAILLNNRIIITSIHLPSCIHTAGEISPVIM